MLALTDLLILLLVSSLASTVIGLCIALMVFKKRSFFRVLLGIVLSVAIIFSALLVTVRFRVVGTWQREIMYLDHYDCYSIMLVEFQEDGDVVTVLSNAQTGAILKTSYGKWKVSGFEVTVYHSGDSSKIPYDFNPFTGELMNGDNRHFKIS